MLEGGGGSGMKALKRSAGPATRSTKGRVPQDRGVLTSLTGFDTQFIAANPMNDRDVDVTKPRVSTV